jgi:hypothetical protein
MKYILINSPGPDFSVVYNDATCNALSGNQCDNWSTSEFALTTNSFTFTPNFTALAPTIAKAFAPATVPFKGTAALTLTLTDPDLATALTGVAFTDTFPAGMVIATPNGLSNTCGGIATAVQGSGSVSLAGATIASNSSCTLTVNVTATNTGSLSNTTGAVTATNTLAGNTASAALLVVGLPPPAIPTLRQWALWLLGLALAIVGAGARMKSNHR